PKIVGVNLEARAEDAQPIVFIEECPECGTELKRTEGEAQHYCPNDLGCRPQIIGKIDHFISRKALNIDGLGTETVSLMVNKGLISNYADLYTLTFDDIIALDRMADKSANNMLQGIEASKQVPFEKVLFGLGIRFVGETVAKKIAQSLLTIDKILTATYDELIAIDEIGDKIALSIIAFAQNEENLAIVERLKTAGLQLETEAEVKASNKLEGLKIVISGVFEKFSRNELKAMIEDNGGKNVGSISAKTSYLVAGDNMGPAKLEKANKLGVEIISELDLEKMITGE
ncbi:helix-hairpin-helix domain-containing protein, partial [Lishizhenia sp.]|uniref:helix-hairpin-helix domain-containing protein n=1 Tax=Lishizhenia sp. TaxID=2497594 RepID=UPI00299DF140